MDLTLLHPKIVHLPMALAVLMPLLSAGFAIAWWRRWFPRRTWIVAVLFQALLVGSGWAAMETGEADEEIVERVVSETVIHDHEEAAELFVWVGAFALLFFIAAALIRDERMAQLLAGVAVISSCVVFYFGYRVGEAGGALVYEHGAASAHVGTPTNVQTYYEDD